MRHGFEDPNYREGLRPDHRTESKNRILPTQNVYGRKVFLAFSDCLNKLLKLSARMMRGRSPKKRRQDIISVSGKCADNIFLIYHVRSANTKSALAHGFGNTAATSAPQEHVQQDGACVNENNQTNVCQF